MSKKAERGRRSVPRGRGCQGRWFRDKVGTGDDTAISLSRAERHLELLGRQQVTQSFGLRETLRQLS